MIKKKKKIKPTVFLYRVLSCKSVPAFCLSIFLSVKVPAIFFQQKLNLRLYALYAEQKQRFLSDYLTNNCLKMCCANYIIFAWVIINTFHNDE